MYKIGEQVRRRTDLHQTGKIIAVKRRGRDYVYTVRWNYPIKRIEDCLETELEKG